MEKFFIGRKVTAAIPSCLGALLCGATLLTAPPIQAASIDELKAEALQKNAELHFYQNEVAAMKGARTQAGLWKNPVFTGEYGERRTRDSGAELKGKGSTQSLSLTQTFEFPGKGSLRKAIANRNVEIAEMSLQQFERALRGRIELLSRQYLAASEAAQAAEEIEERCTTLIELLKTRPTAGVQSLLEVRLIDANHFELQRLKKDSQQQLAATQLEMNQLLGRPSRSPLIILSPLQPPPSLDSQDRLVLSGLNKNIPLKIRLAELERAKRETSSAWLEAFPDFTVGPFFSQDKAGEKETNLGVTLSVPLPLWNWNQGNIQSAQARQDQAQALELDAKRKVEAEIIRRSRALSLTLKMLEKMPATTIDQMHQSADLADRQYRTGAIGVQLFLEMQKQSLNLRQLRSAAVLEAWTHWLDLELLTNTDLEKLK